MILFQLSKINYILSVVKSSDGLEMLLSGPLEYLYPYNWYLFKEKFITTSWNNIDHFNILNHLYLQASFISTSIKPIFNHIQWPSFNEHINLGQNLSLSVFKMFGQMIGLSEFRVHFFIYKYLILLRFYLRTVGKAGGKGSPSPHHFMEQFFLHVKSENIKFLHVNNIWDLNLFIE